MKQEQDEKFEKFLVRLQQADKCNYKDEYEHIIDHGKMPNNSYVKIKNY